MKKNKKYIENRFFSRRQFLVGAGQTFLALPPLLSLMPSIVAAQTMDNKKVRSVIYNSWLGIDKKHLDPDPATILTQGTGHSVFYKTLDSFSGPISRMIDTSFQPLYPYMNLIKGLSLTGGKYQGHSTSFLAGAHSQFRDPTWGRTLDVVMEKSSNVYKPEDIVVSKAVRISSEKGIASYDTFNGVKTSSSYVQGDLSLFNLLFGNLSSGGVPSQTNLNNELIVDKVFADLKKLESDKRLSSDDKILLDRYISGVFDLQKKVKANNAGGGATCTKPSLSLQVKKQGNGYQFPQEKTWGITSTGQLFDNYIEMIKLAFLCDLTRVIMINNTIWDEAPIGSGSAGGLHHECPSSETSADRHQYGLLKMAKLATALMNTPDTLNGSGNLLDNSSIFFTNELGDWTTGHSIRNMPCVTFGKGGGFIKTGYFVDYTNKVNGSFGSGRPYKQLLQTIMRSMGVPQSEYVLYGDGKGYGEFVEGINQFGKVYPTAYSAYKNEHNDVLPFLT